MLFKTLICILFLFCSVANQCYGQRSISSTFVERPDQPPKVFVLDVQYSGNYFLKPAKSHSWQSIPLNNLATINSKIIRDELELNKEQAAEFQKMERRFLEYADERLKIALEKIAEDKSIPGRKKLVAANSITRDLQKTLDLQSDEEVKDLLVPSQYNRLNQLRHQVNEMRLGTAKYLMTPELVQQLGISKKQIAEIQKTDKESDSAIRKSAWNLRKKMLSKNLSTLPENKQNEMRKSIGKEYDWK